MYKRYLLSAASVAALATFMAAPASAFDDSRWDWDLNAKTDIDVDVDVDIKIDPSGATIVEIDQDFKGDLDAKATTIGVFNDPQYDGWTESCTYYYGKKVCEWSFEPLDAATELPNVETSATAVGNVATIESQVSVQADINQSVKDNDWDWSGAQFNATAITVAVVNASVDNSATVAGNVASITLDPSATEESGLTTEVDASNNKPCHSWYCPSPPKPEQGDGVDTDNFLMANIVQSANFDGNAHAFVGGVFISGYDNFNPSPNGDEIRNIVTNTATAVGNVATITVLDGALADD